MERCSDDGEPSGTAGRPMLDLLVGAGVHDVLAVVTRYFGGTLLGTGGIVRAYSAATKEALENCEIRQKEVGYRMTIATDYVDLGKIQYLAAARELKRRKCRLWGKMCRLRMRSLRRKSMPLKKNWLTKPVENVR